MRSQESTDRAKGNIERPIADRISQGRDRGEKTTQLVRAVPHDPLSGPLRDAINADGRSIYAIAKAAGIQPYSMRRFASGERDLMLATAGLLAAEVGLRLKPASESGDRSLAGQIRDAINADGRSIGAIARAARIPPNNLHRLVSGKQQDLMLATAGPVAAVLGLAFTPDNGDSGTRAVPRNPLSGPLRDAINADGRSFHAIARAARIDYKSVRRLASGSEEKMMLATAGLLAAEVGLRLKPASESGDRSLAGQIRDAINADGRSFHAIAVAAGIPSGKLYKFVSGQNDMVLATAGPLASELGLSFGSGVADVSISQASRTAPLESATASRKCPIELRGVEFPILFNGNPLAYLTGYAYDMLGRLVNDFHQGRRTPAKELAALGESKRIRALTEALDRNDLKPLRKVILETKEGRNKFLEIIPIGQ